MDGRVVDVAREAMARRRVPGLLIAVGHGMGTELWHEGVDAAGEPFTGGALFPVASLTKLATALAVLRLLDAGPRVGAAVLQAYGKPRSMYE